MFSTNRAEKYRESYPMKPSKTGDPFGWFEIPTTASGPTLRVLASGAYEEFEFDHVSVSLAHRCPIWEEMCRVKDLFWDAEDTVVQFHPPKSDYVNQMRFCLHLWRWTKGEFPRPYKIEVGI